MTVKYFEGEVPAMTDGGRDPMADRDWPTLTATATERWQAAINRFDLDEAAEAAIGLVREVDAFINDTEPFRVAKDDTRREELAGILGRCLEAVRIAATLLHPFFRMVLKNAGKHWGNRLTRNLMNLINWRLLGKTYSGHQSAKSRAVSTG